MSRTRLFFATLGLGLGLVFYFAHRSDATLSNRLLGLLLGSHHAPLKHEMQSWLPLPAALRACLPSALWCFVGATLCGGWRFQLGRRLEFGAGLIFPAINAGWEAVQWLGWTDGHADWRDVLAGPLGWAAARAIFLPLGSHGRSISTPWDWRIGVVLVGLACMGVADVWP